MAPINVPLMQGHDPCHRKEIRNHVPFDLQIQGAVRIHRRRHVNLDQPGLEVRVYQDIEPQHFKTRINVLNRLIEGREQYVLPTNDGLHNKLVDFLEQLFGLRLADIVGKEILQRGKAPLAAEVLLVLGGLLELGVLLVDAVVGQVLELAVLGVLVGVVVDLGRETGQALLVYVDS